MLHGMPCVTRQVYAFWSLCVLCWGLCLALWSMTVLCDDCVYCVALGFVGHILALCYYSVLYGASMWVVVISIL